MCIIILTFEGFIIVCTGTLSLLTCFELKKWCVSVGECIHTPIFPLCTLVFWVAIRYFFGNKNTNGLFFSGTGVFANKDIYVDEFIGFYLGKIVQNPTHEDEEKAGPCYIFFLKGNKGYVLRVPKIWTTKLTSLYKVYIST